MMKLPYGVYCLFFAVILQGCANAIPNAEPSSILSIQEVETNALRALCATACPTAAAFQELISYNWCRFEVNYCSWTGITCINNTEIISRLMVGTRTFSRTQVPLFCGKLPEEIANISSLEWLILPDNHITQLPDSIGKLSSLQLLRIRNCHLTDLPSSLSQLDSLIVLDVSLNRFDHLPIPICGLPSLKSLSVIGPGNRITHFPECITNLKALVKLYAYRLQLEEFPETCANWTAMSSLFLASNNLKTLPNCVGLMKELTSISASGNMIETLPDSMAQLKKFYHASFADNKLTDISVVGKIPSLIDLYVQDNRLRTLPDLNNLTKLINLGVERNMMSELPPSIGKLRLLETLFVDGNKLTELPDSIVNCKSLITMYASGNMLSSLPENFGDLSYLDDVELDNNQIGRLPDSFGNLTELMYLSVRQNHLTDLPFTMRKLQYLHSLNLNDNPLGVLPTVIFELKNLRILKIAACSLQSLPESIGSLPFLNFIHASQNKLARLPEGMGKLKMLSTLMLVQNNLVSIHSTLGSMTNLRTLSFARNFLTEIPSSVEKLKNLYSLDLSYNRIKYLPPGLGNLKQLSRMYFDSNLIEEIPHTFRNLKKAKILRLSSCNLKSIPDIFGSMNILTDVYLNYNSLTTLPKSLFNVSSLAHLKLRGNALEYIPPSLCLLSGLTYLDISSNKFKFIPEQLTKLTQLSHLDISMNQISQLPPHIFSALDLLRILVMKSNMITDLVMKNMSKLEYLDISDNPLSKLPSSLTSFKNLRLLLARNCSLSEIPKDISILPYLHYLDISSNRLTALPDGLSKLISLVTLNSQRNQIRSVPDLRSLINLRLLDLSHNNIQQRIGDILAALQDLPVLNVLILDDATSSKFSETLYEGLNLVQTSGFTETGSHEKFASLSSLSLAGCRIRGPLTDFPYYPWLNFQGGDADAEGGGVILGKLVNINLANNDIKGTFPTADDPASKYSWNGYPLNFWLSLLSNVNLGGNAGLADVTGTLTTGLEFDKTQQQIFSTSFSVDGVVHESMYLCFGTMGSTRALRVGVDPSYYSYQECTCATGFIGIPPYCWQCPSYPVEVAHCENGKILLEQGWWAPGQQMEISTDPLALKPPSPSQLVRCPSVSLSSSDCLGTDANGTFQCAEHTSGRFCSQCEYGYYRSGMTCKSCAEQAQWVTIIVLSFVAVFLLAFSSFKRASSGATIKIFVFYCQTLWVFLPRVSNWDLGAASEWIMSALGIGSGVTLFGIECLVPLASATARYALRFFVMASLPLLIVLTVPLIMRIIPTILRNGTSDWSISVSPTLFLLFYLYIPCSTVLLSPLSVAEEILSSNDSAHYVTNAPWILVSDTVWKNGIRPVAILGTITYTFGLPLALAFAMWKKRGNIRSVNWMTILWAAFRVEMPAFELIVMIRRIAIVLAVSLFQFDSIWVPVIVFITVLAALIIQLEFKPYRSRIDNMFEAVSLVVILVSYLGGILDNTRSMGAKGSTELLIVILNILLISAFLVRIIYEAFKKVSTVSSYMAEKSMGIILQKYSTSKKLAKHRPSTSGMSIGLIAPLLEEEA